MHAGFLLSGRRRIRQTHAKRFGKTIQTGLCVSVCVCVCVCMLTTDAKRSGKTIQTGVCVCVCVHAHNSYVTCSRKMFQTDLCVCMCMFMCMYVYVYVYVYV